MTREKIVDYWASSFIVIADEGKVVANIPGGRPIPIEVLPFAWRAVKEAVERRLGGGEARLRIGSDKRGGPVVTDNGNYVLDYVHPLEEIDVGAERELKSIPGGVVEVGIFNGSKVSKAIIGTETGVSIME